MKINCLLLVLLVKVCACFAADVDITPGLSTLIDSTPAAISQWVSPGPEGKLTYKTTERGDKIMDFSQAGYKGGGVAIPNPPVKITLSPSPGDNTGAIQQAIDQVSKMPMQNGSRGSGERCC